MSKQLKLSLIRTDGGTQMRAEIQEDVYLDYRDKMLEGIEFDPVDVFHDGAEYWLGDGFHRFYGAREAKLETIPANVRRGTKRDAILFATGANASHGLRRSNADKRRAVETLLNDSEWVKWSDSKIAEQAGVSQPFVREIRNHLITVITSPAAKSSKEPRIGKDGKAYPAPKRSETGKPGGVSSSSEKTPVADGPASSQPAAIPTDEAPAEPRNGKEPKDGPGDSRKSRGKETPSASKLVDELTRSHVGYIARGLTTIAEVNGGEGEQFRVADAGLNQLIGALQEMRGGKR